MRPEADRLGMPALLRAGWRRTPWRMAGVGLVALLAAGALFGILVTLQGMNRLVQGSVDQLGADMVLAQPGQAEAVRRLLQGEPAGNIPDTIPTALWKQMLKKGQVLGLRRVEGWTVVDGRLGNVTTGDASVVLVKLERYASPLVARQEIEAALPRVEVVTAEQAVRQVTHSLVPLIRILTAGAGAGLLGAVLLGGLVTSLQATERQRELGVMRAIGASGAFLIWLLAAETGAAALAGAAAGVLAAGLALAAVPDLARVAALLPAAQLALQAAAALLAVVGAVLMAAMAAATGVARMDPLEAVRRG